MKGDSMKKIICVMLLFVSCVYGGGEEFDSVQIAKVYVKNLRTLGMGYCLGYDVEKLYDEMSWFKHVDKSARNAIISEIKDIADTQKGDVPPPSHREYDETGLLFINCFLMDHLKYREAMQHIAEKYCVKNCDAVRGLRDSSCLMYE